MANCPLPWIARGYCSTLIYWWVQFSQPPTAPVIMGDLPDLWFWLQTERKIFTNQSNNWTGKLFFYNIGLFVNTEFPVGYLHLNHLVGDFFPYEKLQHIATNFQTKSSPIKSYWCPMCHIPLDISHASLDRRAKSPPQRVLMKRPLLSWRLPPQGRGNADVFRKK